MKAKLLKKISYALATIGVVASGAASIGCIILYFDEPEAPASIVE